MPEMTRFSAREIYEVAREAGFSPDQAVTMTAIALAESSGDLSAHNDSGEDSRGLWQINVRAHKHLADADLTDPLVNAKAAFEVSKRGSDISPWTVTHGNEEASYLEHRETAQAAAEAAGEDPDLGYWGGVRGYGDHTPADAPDPAGTDSDPEPTAEPDTDADTEPDTGPDAAEGNEALQTFLDKALAQTGDTYDFGVEVDLDDPDPEAFDCSELVEWAASQAGVDLPNWTVGQYRHLAKEDALMSVEEALETPGALLFRFSEDPLTGNPQSRHVAISLGDGRTIEARGSAYGVGSWDADDRGFTYAAYVPEFGNAPLAEQPTDVDEPVPEDSRTEPAEPAADPELVDPELVDPELEELRDLAENYNTAAQGLHDEALATIEGKGSPELVDAMYERGGLKAQLEALPENRAAYEERRDAHREEADRLNAEVTRLEKAGKAEEAEETLEEVLRADARARLDQKRIDQLDQREDALTRRVEELDEQIAQGMADEELQTVKARDLEADADSLDDAHRALQGAIAARQEAAQAQVEAERAGAEGDTERQAQLEQQAEEALQRSRDLVEQATDTVPDTDTVQQALEEAEQLNRTTTVLVGEDALADPDFMEPEVSDDELAELSTTYGRAAEDLHLDALLELEEAGEAQVFGKDPVWNKAEGLKAQLEHARAQRTRAEEKVEDYRSQVAQLREEARSLEQQGKAAPAEEKLELAERSEVMAGVYERSADQFAAREAELTTQHEKAMETVTEAMQRVSEGAGREKELEQTADQLDDAQRTVDEAIRVRAEARRLDAEARTAKAAGDTERYQELSRQSAQRLAKSDELARQAREMVPDNAAAQEALIEAQQPLPGDLIDLDEDGDASAPGPEDIFGDEEATLAAPQLAHELAHVLQQEDSIEPPDDLEQTMAEVDQMEHELTGTDFADDAVPEPDTEPVPVPEPEQESTFEPEPVPAPEPEPESVPEPLDDSAEPIG